MSNWILLSLILVQLHFKSTSSTIFTQINGSYIGIYDDTNTYNWFEAKSYCMSEYGSTLASIHSLSDESTALSTRSNTGTTTFVGLNDLNSESRYQDQTLNTTWQWSDGTSYDFALTWDIGEPNDFEDGEDCVEYESDGEANDYSCDQSRSQFVCNSATNWRPIFKISTNVSDYGNQENSFQFWKNGDNNFNDYTSDINYILNQFNASQVDYSGNYRSPVLDDWGILFNNSEFDTVKVSLYANGSEVVYFVYHATLDKQDWFSQSNLIESSYRDTGYESYNYWSILGVFVVVIMVMFSIVALCLCSLLVNSVLCNVYVFSFRSCYFFCLLCVKHKHKNTTTPKTKKFENNI